MGRCLPHMVQCRNAGSVRLRNTLNQLSSTIRACAVRAFPQESLYVRDDSYVTPENPVEGLRPFCSRHLRFAEYRPAKYPQMAHDTVDLLRYDFV